MAFSFESLNKESKKTIRDGINTEAMKFHSLKEYVGQTLSVDGFFFTTGGKWGEQVVVIAGGDKINMPKRCVAEFKSIRDNDEALNMMLDGKMIITDIAEYSAENGKTVTFNFGTKQ